MSQSSGMKNFSKMFEQSRATARAARGLPPIEEEKRPPQSVIFPSKQEKQESPTPTKRVASLEERWERMAKAIEKLEPVYCWAAEQNPGSEGKAGALEILGRVEAQCVEAARSGQTEKFSRLQKGYLESVGKLCELFFLSHGENFTIPAMKLGLVGLDLVPSSKPLTEGKRQYHLTEIPFLLSSTVDQVQSIGLAREVFSETTIVSV